MIHFGTLDRAPRGTLTALLHQAYAVLLDSGVPIWRQEALRWDQFDDEAYTMPQVGRCVFLTWSDDALAGFASFDPRGAPAKVLVGHHCVIPSFRGHGIGRAQFNELLRRIYPIRALEIEARTLSLPFFEAACRLYSSSGFAPVERSPWSHDQTVDQIVFRKRLT